MSDYQRKHYLVAPDSPAMQKIRKMLDQAEAAHKAFRAFADEFGASQIWTSGPWLSGLGKFRDDVIPYGWREDPKRGYCVPDAKCKLGRSIRERMKALPRRVDGWECSSIFGFSHWADNHVYFPVTENIGEQWVISVHEDQPEVPEGCVLLKRSEYWALKEAAAEVCA